jgi:hypothetical protein
MSSLKFVGGSNFKLTVRNVVGMGSCEAAEHDAAHSDVDHGDAGLEQAFVIPRKATGAGEPSESACNHPPSPYALKAFALLSGP